jgi:hypothetical protein
MLSYLAYCLVLLDLMCSSRSINMRQGKIVRKAMGFHWRSPTEPVACLSERPLPSYTVIQKAPSVACTIPSSCAGAVQVYLAHFLTTGRRRRASVAFSPTVPPVVGSHRSATWLVARLEASPQPCHSTPVDWLAVRSVAAHNGWDRRARYCDLRVRFGDAVVHYILEGAPLAVYVPCGLSPCFRIGADHIHMSSTVPNRLFRWRPRFIISGISLVI